MDLGTTIIGIICVAICAMPFILTNRSRKKKVKQQLLSLKDLAKQQNCDITQHEICGNYAIGIDQSKNFVFFQLKSSREEIKQQFVDLSAVKDCNIVNINRSTTNNSKIIERLELHLTPKDKNKPGIVLEFYNNELSYQFSGEMQSIEKWGKLVNDCLNSENKAP